MAKVLFFVLLFLVLIWFAGRVLRVVLIALGAANQVRNARDEYLRRAREAGRTSGEASFGARRPFGGQPGGAFFDEEELERLRQARRKAARSAGAASGEKDISDRVRILEEKRPTDR